MSMLDGTSYAMDGRFWLYEENGALHPKASGAGCKKDELPDFYTIEKGQKCHHEMHTTGYYIADRRMIGKRVPGRSMYKVVG